MRSYIIFHRHGQRAPAISVFAHASLDYDWNKILPKEEDLSHLSQKFPIISHILNDKPRDIKSYPFGCLSDKGVKHLYSIGANIAAFLPDTFLSALSRPPKTFSTNYQRTQVSTQSLAMGLGLEDHEIEVRNSFECPMCIYDAFPELTRRLIAETQHSEVFKNAEKSEQVLQLKVLLLAEFPSLNRPGGRFDWMAAFDYFACRRAHHIDISPTVVQAEEPLQKYIASRFHLYNRNPTHLALVAAPLLDEVISTLTGDVMSGSRHDRKQKYRQPGAGGNTVACFSCHDVTLLALLHALGAAEVSGDDSDYWPYYGCNIIFEAICDSAMDLQEDDNVVINIYLDLKPLRFDPALPLNIVASAMDGARQEDIDITSRSYRSRMSLKELKILSQRLQMQSSGRESIADIVT